MKLKSLKLKKIAATALILTSVPFCVQAKVSLNAMCYMNQSDKQEAINGNNTDQEFELASLSKAITSYWALSTLGPNYRFENKINITPVSADEVDIHIEGTRDPYFGQTMYYFLVSELNKIGIKKVRTLSFDEKLEVNWYVADPHYQSKRSFDPTPQEVEAQLDHAFVQTKFNMGTYKIASASIQNQLGIKMTAKPQLKVQEVKYIAAANFQKSPATKVYVMKSAPLYKYLKFMNLHSNNYMADMLFRILGGDSEFEKFMKSNLSLDQTDVTFVNGSGDSEYLDNKKVYNKASCSTLVTVIYSMRALLLKNNLDLKNVMSVGGSDNSTLGGRYADLGNKIVAKTGSVNPAITLGGMVSTQKGDLIFAVLEKTDGPADWTNARNQIRDKISKLVKDNKGAVAFKYQGQGTLPIDSQSVLTEVLAQKMK